MLPTGGGKSLCYQVPALVQDGMCLVISPLIALMQDQVSRLQEVGVPSACLFSGMNYKQVKQVLTDAQQGEYKLLYVSPERLQTYLFNDYLPTLDLNLIAIDEAHCVSQWGHDFRPDYLRIAELRELFTRTPMLALTASATADIQQDIATQLKLRKPIAFRQSFQRKNIHYSVNYSENKNGDMLSDLSNECSIIYCRSRKQTETTGKILEQKDLASAVYHAGLKKEDREAAQVAWMANEARVMVATTAFGMGIDKPDVRMVLHYDAPEHLEAWYQEAGRAGRDGKPSVAKTLYNTTDITRLEESTALMFPPEAYLRRVYQSVAEYLQIPVGGEPHKYYPFDVFDFCNKFHYKALEVIHALKLLERDGLWTMTEAVYSPSTIQFVTDRQVLDNLQRSHPQLAYLATGLLRMFNTIFYFPTPIRESAIAYQLRIKKDELLNGLMQLHRMEILEYNKPGEGPQLFFHHRRADSAHLIINTNRIHVLRKRHEARTEAMLHFLNNHTICRERLMLEYFGEQPENDCGHCDVCDNKKAAQFTTQSLKNSINNLFAKGPVTFQQLLAQFPPTQKEKATQLVRQMVDDGTLRVTQQGLLAAR